MMNDRENAVRDYDGPHFPDLTKRKHLITQWSFSFQSREVKDIKSWQLWRENVGGVPEVLMAVTFFSCNRSSAYQTIAHNWLMNTRKKVDDRQKTRTSVTNRQHSISLILWTNFSFFIIINKLNNQFLLIINKSLEIDKLIYNKK